jgi:thiol-disulfide isomerase/thioredoxin
MLGPLALGLLIAVSAFSGQNAAASETANTPVHQRQLQDMSGNFHDLPELIKEGDNIALIFWQTWCATCKAELPIVSKTAKNTKLGIKFFGIISGSDDFVDDAKVLDYASKLKLTFPQIRDRDASLSEQFQIDGTPTIIVFSNGGKILYRGHTLPMNWNQLSQ